MNRCFQANLESLLEQKTRRQKHKSPSSRIRAVQKPDDVSDTILTNGSAASNKSTAIGSEEFRMISSAVLDIKKSFDESDPEFQSLETIEQSLESLIGKLNSLKTEALSVDSVNLTRKLLNYLSKNLKLCFRIQ